MSWTGALAKPPPASPKPKSPFEGDELRRMFSRRYERRLVERGLATRPNTSTVVHDEEEEGDEGGSPRVEHLEMTPELAEELDDWLGRVVLVDGAKRFPAKSLGRAFVNAWRRAGGESPLPPSLALVPSARSSVEVTACPVLDATPLASPGRAVTPATDPQRKEGDCMTPYQERIVETQGLVPKDAAARLGISVGAVYAARSMLRKQGKLGGELPALPKHPKPVARKGGGPRAVELVATVEQTDDDLIAPLRTALEQLEVKRARIVAGIVALGGRVT